MPWLKDKVAIVTGGSRGIGRAIVDRFLSEGASVVATGRSAPEAMPKRPDFAFAKADASRAADVDAVVKEAVDRFGGLDVLVNNAGVQIEKTIEQTSEEEWDRILDVNLKSVFLHARAALAPMRRRGGGSIVNIGSYDGFVADPNLAAYCASKGGVHALTRAIAVDHGRDGIRCNVICPGWIATEMAEAYLASQPDPAAARRALASIHPVGRSGRPSDIAALATWLASDESSFVTGQMFVADGGLTARAPQPH
jgi:meso-butanediol dehydrogenase/(S,S)-butanediol dehydrogenase/diacetyl reductase